MLPPRWDGALRGWLFTGFMILTEKILVLADTPADLWLCCFPFYLTILDRVPCKPHRKKRFHGRRFIHSLSLRMSPEFLRRPVPNMRGWHHVKLIFLFASRELQVCKLRRSS